MKSIVLIREKLKEKIEDYSYEKAMDSIYGSFYNIVRRSYMDRD